MAFDFPSSPTTGQAYSISGGPTYVYNGTAWVVLTPGNQFNRMVFTATAGQTTFSMSYVVGAVDVYRNGVKLAPADFTATNGTSIVLANGCTVGDTVEVISYPMITYSDAVRRTGDTMTGALAVPMVITSSPMLFRNYIINGNFDIWQRGTATGSWGAPVTNFYWADRWVANSSGTGGNGSMSRQAFTPGQTDVPGEPTYFQRWQITSAASGQTTGSCWVEQRIEDVRSLAGKTATLSFYAKGTGTLPNIYATQVFGTGGSTLVVLTLASNVVLNAGWTKYTYTFTYPSISGKTIGTSSYIGITFMVPLNSTYTFDLAQVQLEEGSVATPFERRPIGTELTLCQRYYEIGQQPMLYIGFGATGIGAAYGEARYAVTKRVSPTIVTGSGWQYYSGGGGVSFSPSTVGILDRFYWANAGFTNWNGWTGSGTWAASAEL